MQSKGTYNNFNVRFHGDRRKMFARVPTLSGSVWLFQGDCNRVVNIVLDKSKYQVNILIFHKNVGTH